MSGEEIRNLRKQLGMTQAELSRELGISQSMLSLLESDHSEPSGRVAARLAHTLRGVGLTGRGSTSASQKLRYPDLETSVDRSVRDVLTWQVWERERPSGDFVFVHGLPPRVATGRDLWTEHTVFICIGDIAGHGTAAVPGAFHVQAWLRGRLSGHSGLPRLEEIVHALSDELEAVGIGMSAAFAILKIRPESPASAMLESISCGLFPPILVEGPRQRVLGTADFGSTLPLRGSAIEVRQSTRLTGPWKLAGGTDGFLGRVGNGDEQAGMAALRTHLTSATTSACFHQFCETQLPALDDELAFVFQPRERWDVEIECAAADSAEKNRFRALVEQHLTRRQRIERRGLPNATKPHSPWGEEDDPYCPLSDADRIWMVRAVMEAIFNAAIYGSPDGTSPITLRFRDEGSALRVVVEDAGAGTLNRQTIENSEGGLQVVRAACPRGIFVEDTPEGGNRLTLLKDRSSEITS